MSSEDLQQILDRQRRAFRFTATSHKQRMQALADLRDAIHRHEDALIQAMHEDFGNRSTEETRLLELFPTYAAIRHTRRHLRGWMRKRRVLGSWFLQPASAWYQYQALGVVGIMGAWNYPIQLCLGPLIDAIAAGNHVMLKPSELAPHTAEVIAKLIAEVFEPEYITVVNGDVDTARAFSSLPFDHLLFTGSTNVGRQVMKAAAENLTPVTLELGGKSPAIIHPSFSAKVAASRIMTDKLYNAGQTCIAPDYVLIHESQVQAFTDAAQAAVEERYPDGFSSTDYTRIISEAHYERLFRLVDEAQLAGARVMRLGRYPKELDATPKVFPPVLVFNADPKLALMQEEIFGPILPLITYKELDEAIEYVNNGDRPLALYYFDHHRKRIKSVLQKTIAGGVTINDCIYHIGQHRLPFGGVGNSGMGHYHGFDGFVTFSKKKPVMHQSRFAVTSILAAPFTDSKKKLIDILLTLVR
jgi:coniferyl-aldehyde dehydrogenase